MDHSVASRHRRLENQGKRAAQQQRSHSDLKDVNYEGTLVKAPPCPERKMRTPDIGRRKPVECSRKNNSECLKVEIAEDADGKKGDKRRQKHF